ncbi:conserved Plasmodium protein, unknown function [Plasmodium relictum]|uniref:Uncharacterized protein n=1 Tax=Plasmodium relictum TaxID=85471 RepID=A0A1J1H2P8_PLARL|nr:conserved Plasmodium protein, unknown function [Plasmodium relictum]CRG98989.1 conserved Plasmodium protein, unknown function [Plasmodium relictum]
MDRRRRKRKIYFLFYIIYFYFILFYFCVCIKNIIRDDNKNYDKLNECKNILPFYLNNPDHCNLLNEINLSNNYSIRWNINYLYFQYFNNNIFINFYLHSIYVKDVELFEYTNKSVLLLRKDAIENEVTFVKYIEFDKSMINKNKKRTFYLTINTIHVPNNDVCMDVTLEMNIRTIDNLKDEKIKRKNNKLPLHNKNYIIIKDNYYYVTNDDYIFNLNEANDFYIDNKDNKIINIYSVSFFVDFNKHGNITFFSFLTRDIKNSKNLFFELKKIKLSTNFLNNMSIDNILNFANDDQTCTNNCIQSKNTKKGIFLNTLLENNCMYKFLIKYKMDNNKEENIITNYDEYIHFNLEYSIIHNSNDYTFVDYIRERFSECIYNSFLPNKIIQTEKVGISTLFSNKQCFENKNCSTYDIDEFVIYDRVIELNDNFILNFDSVNLFEEEQKISIIVSEDSLFNFSLISKSENIYVNILKKDNLENVCNTYYLNNIKDYNLYDYITKDKTNFSHKHFNDIFHNEKKEKYSLKNFSLQNIIYINCILKKGEYDLKINVESFNMICDSNEINLLIHPLHMYEENHKCDIINGVTELFDSHLVKETEEKQNKNLNDTLDKSEFKTYYKIYERKWILNNQLMLDYDFIMLYEKNIIENIDEIVITINNSIFLDIFFLIIEVIKGESYYYVYKESRRKTKYKLKYNNSCSIYIFTANLHYAQKDLCGFFFVDIEFVNTKQNTEEKKIFNYNNIIEKINYIPNFIISFDNYMYSNFCYIPSYKKHSLTIYLLENSIIKINCFTENYIYIYLIHKNKKIYEGYNHLYIESFTKGEYEIVFEFNSQNDKTDNSFFYLQIYIYHLSYIHKCVTDDGDNLLIANNYLKETSDSPFDLSSYKGNDEKKEESNNEKNFFFYKSQNSYYIFKRAFLFLHPNKRTIMNLKLPQVKNLDNNIFFLKIELVFHKNFFPFKMTLEENKDNFLIHSSNSYKNKIIMLVSLLNNKINLFKLCIELYEDIDKNLENSYCSYAYLNITYTNEVEHSDIGFNDILNYSTISMPMLLNNIFLKNFNIKDQYIDDGNNNNKIKNELKATVSFKNSNSFIYNQSIDYFFQTISNNTTIFLVERDLFFNIYLYRENYGITLKIFKYSNKELESEEITYDEINRNIIPKSEEIYSFSNKHIYIPTYLEKGLYIFKFENNLVPFFIKLSIIHEYENEIIKENNYLRADKNEKNLINYKVKDTLSSYDFSNDIVKDETYYFFDKELHCNETNDTSYHNKNLDSVIFFFEEVMNKNFFKIYNKMETFLRDNSENMLVYKRFFICLKDKDNSVYNDTNNYNTINFGNNNNYKIFSMNIEVDSQIYIEIKPHCYLFMYPFHLTITSKDSYFKISNRDKNFITTYLSKGEYEILLSFPLSKNLNIKNIIFDLIILFVTNNNNIMPNWNELDYSANNLKQKYVHNDNCKINSYKYLFSKVNLVDMNKDDYSINKNIVNSKFKSKYFQNFDKYFISNSRHEIFFTIPDYTYFLKIFFVSINELMEDIEEKNKKFSNFYDFSSNYMNNLLKRHNNINIQVFLHKEKESRDINNEFENEEDSSYVRPLYYNESEEYVLNLYKVEKNFKVLIQTNNFDCNYFKLIISLYPINFYNQLYHYNDSHYINEYLEKLFNTLSTKIQKYEGIRFKEKKLSNYSYINLNTDIIFLRNNNHQDVFSFPLKIGESSYFKINIGYNFSLVNFEIRLIKNNITISNSNKMEVNLDNRTINIFENISLYLEKGNYELKISVNDLIENIADLNSFNFPFYFELQIFEFFNEENNDTVLLDIFPDNSIYIDKNYTFFIDIIFWGTVNEKIYLEDYEQNHLELKNKRVIKYKNIEVHKIILLTEEMVHIGQEFFLKFNTNINLNEGFEKKLNFTFLNDNVNKVNKKNYEILLNNGEKTEFDYVSIDSKNSNYPHNASNEEWFYDLDKIVQNYRFNEEKEENKADFILNESLNNENDFFYIPIFSFDIFSFEKENFSSFMFIFSAFCLSCAFIFTLIKLYKHWKYYRNYNIISESEETTNLFYDDDL